MRGEDPGILSALLMLALIATAFALLVGGGGGAKALWRGVGYVVARMAAMSAKLAARLAVLVGLGLIDFVVTSWIVAYHLATVVRAHEVPDDVAGLWWRCLDRASRLLAV